MMMAILVSNMVGKLSIARYFQIASVCMNTHFLMKRAREAAGRCR